MVTGHNNVKVTWFRRNLNLILGFITILSVGVAIAGWTREIFAGWLVANASAANNSENINKLDNRVNIVSGRVTALEARVTNDERQNDVEHARLLTELPLIKEDLGEIKKDVRQLLGKPDPHPIQP